MGIFGGIETAQTYGAGTHIEAGTHELEIHAVTNFESSQHAGRHYFCVEADVINSTNAVHVPGQRLSWLVNMQTPSALSNCLGFAQALDPAAKKDDITEELMEALCGSEQPSRGVRVRAIASMIKTRAGGDFTKVSWEALA